MADKKYMYHGKLVFVGNFDHNEFCSFWLADTGEFKRLGLKELPVRKTIQTARKDLDKWASARRLKEA